MQFVVFAVFIACGLAIAGCGAAELLTGWTLPTERGRVLRPVPHGLGMLSVGTGFSGFVGAATWATSGGRTHVPLFAAGAALIALGNILLATSRLPGR